MKKIWIVLYVLFGCTQKKRVDDLAFKFCDKVSPDKAEYLKCYTDIVECYNLSSNKFDADMKFIECARLFQVKLPPPSVPKKFKPILSENEIDAEVWRQIEEMETIDPRKKPRKIDSDVSLKVETPEPKKTEKKAEPVPVSVEKKVEKIVEPNIEKPIEKPVEPKKEKSASDFDF
jgi:hypothetical protein